MEEQETSLAIEGFAQFIDEIFVDDVSSQVIWPPTAHRVESVRAVCLAQLVFSQVIMLISDVYILRQQVLFQKLSLDHFPHFLSRQSFCKNICEGSKPVVGVSLGGGGQVAADVSVAFRVENTSNTHFSRTFRG